MGSALASDTPTPALASGRLQSIDLMRGAAAVAVVIHHAVNAGLAPPLGTPWFPAVQAVSELGRIGVPLFFVLSGFCIHARWARQRAAGAEPQVDFKVFWRRRILRLYPPYFVALTLSMGLVVAAYLNHSATHLLDVYPQPQGRWIALDFLAHVTMLHGLHPVFDRAGGNAPFWTLAREEYFYLLYLPLIGARQRWGLWPVMLGVLALSLIFPIALSPWAPRGTPWGNLVASSAFTLWIQWCLGMVAAEVAMRRVALPKMFSSLLGAAGFGVLAYAAQEHAEPLAPVLWGLVFFNVVNTLVRHERNGRWPKHPVVRFFERLGLISYSIYLVHHPVRSVVKHLLEGGVTSTHPLTYAAATSVVVLAGCTAGWIFFRLVESRFLWATPSGGPASPGAKSSVAL